LIIDVFSKKIWVIPVKRKDAKSMVDALNSWLDDIGEPRPDVMGTDEGTITFFRTDDKIIIFFKQKNFR